ncbi:hypothetical protein F5Y14DRAFT_455439 [Nemania sp. NC0429]|nr:hypothetical protein F5Y14DRAFT_455439 [Nemania sp. NC0429]
MVGSDAPGTVIFLSQKNDDARETQSYPVLYFTFNKDTGELLLHDISEKADTNLGGTTIRTNQLGTKEELGLPEIWKTPRQCVVLLGREWLFDIDRAKVRLIARQTANDADGAAFAQERLEFARIADKRPTARELLNMLELRKK